MTDPFMLQPFACGVELLLRTLPSKCIARVTLLPERRTNIAKLVRPTLQCFRTICCTFHSTPSRRICRAATHRISKTNVHSCPCQARRIYRACFSARPETAAPRDTQSIVYSVVLYGKNSHVANHIKKTPAVSMLLCRQA